MSHQPRCIAPRLSLPVARLLAPALTWLPVCATARGVEVIAIGLAVLVLLLVLAAPLHVAFTMGVAGCTGTALVQAWQGIDHDGGDGPASGGAAA